nr:unnamed protein product [Spirometra erinaceieuropaei]
MFEARVDKRSVVPSKVQRPLTIAAKMIAPKAASSVTGGSPDPFRSFRSSATLADRGEKVTPLNLSTANRKFIYRTGRQPMLATETCRCPIGCNHWIPKISLTRHVQSCRLRSKGYSKKEIAAFWPHDCEQITAGSTQAEERKEDLLMLHSTTLLNLSESAAHKSSKSGPETSISARTPTAQELAFVRDLKRRRRSYRGVHTAKRSYIDVLREVISHHTELLRDGSFEQPQSAADTPPSSRSPKRFGRMDGRIRSPTPKRQTYSNRRSTRFE